MNYEIQISEPRKGTWEAKLVDTRTSSPIEFRVVYSQENLQSQIAEWKKRFGLKQAI